MYQRCVGEGGMSAHYFMHSLTLSEANDYIKGHDRRGRQSWEQTRVIVNTLIGIMGGEAPDWTFPWEELTEAEKAQNAEQEAEDWKKLEAMARQLNEQNKKKKE